MQLQLFQKQYSKIICSLEFALRMPPIWRYIDREYWLAIHLNKTHRRCRARAHQGRHAAVRQQNICMYRYLHVARLDEMTFR